MKKVLLPLIIAALPLCSSVAQQVPNGGFELWEDAGTVVDEPVDWSSIKTSDAGEFINNAAPQVWELSDDAHMGNYSVKLTNKTQFGIVANGNITCGRIHVHPGLNVDSSFSYTVIGDERWSEPFTYRPDSLVGYYKFYPQGDDSCQVRALVHVGEGSIPAFETIDNWVGEAHWKSPSTTVETWTRFSTPFIYNDDRTPGYLLMICNIEEAGEATDGSYVFYDDLELIYNDAGIDDPQTQASLIYAYNGSVYLDKLPVDFLKDARVKLTTILGRTLYEQPVTSTTVSFRELEIREGIYVVTILSDERAVRTKIYLN